MVLIFAAAWLAAGVALTLVEHRAPGWLVTVLMVVYTLALVGFAVSAGATGFVWLSTL